MTHIPPQYQQKNHQDVLILTEMAADLDAYLTSEVLFWPLGDRPTLTMGGFLMRRHRLHALFLQLPEADQQAVTEAEETFQQALNERIVRTEQKVSREIEARLRQWGEYLKDLAQKDRPIVVNYPAAVETRLMLSTLFDLLQQPPYQFDTSLRQRLKTQDRLLRSRWEEGDFVLMDGWQPAYPQETYWWLYGRPSRQPDA